MQVKDGKVNPDNKTGGNPGFWKKTRIDKSNLAGLAGASILLGLFAKLSQKALDNKLTGLDDNFEKLTKQLFSPILDPYFKVFTVAGKPVSTLSLATISAVILLKRKQFLSASLVFGAVGGSWLINQPLKLVFNRRRPLSLKALKNHPNTYSYPSGHTTLAMAYYGIMGWLGWKFFKQFPSRLSWVFIMAFVVTMIGLSRIYRKDHHPSDVLGSYLLASGWVTLLLAAIDIFSRGRDAKK